MQQKYGNGKTSQEIHYRPIIKKKGFNIFKKLTNGTKIYRLKPA